MAHAGKRKRKGMATALLILGAAAFITALAGISARYVWRKSNVSAAAANRFYFTSDLLDEADAEYTLSPETGELTIELRNYADELRWAGTDIRYSYTVKKDGVQTDSGNGTIQKKEDAGSISEIKLTTLTAGTYEVTAVSETPFSSTLTGRFIIPAGESGVHFRVSDSEGSAQALLTVYTDNYSGNVTIDWPSGVIPDSTQEAFAAVKSWGGDSYDSGSLTVLATPYSSYTYRFIKTDSAMDYSDGTAIKAAAN